MRQKDVDAARKVLGTAVGVVHTDKVFKGYIELELQVCALAASAAGQFKQHPLAP